MRGRLLLMPLFALLGGCATHPLPENFTGNTTQVIVKKIQCESQEALDHITEDIFRKSTDREFAVRYADEIEAGTLQATDILKYPKKYPLKLDLESKNLFLYYTLSAVTFDFQLVSMETNENSFNTDLRLPFVSSLFTLGGAADAKLQRQNTQKFEITNSFYELHDIEPGQCNNLTVRSGNVIYPIIGSIGIEGVFRRFVDLDSGAGSTKVPDSTHQFTEQLQFTTTLMASVTPKLALNPVTAQTLRFADAFGTLSATRMDMHQVTIAIAKGPLLTTFDSARQTAKIKSLTIADANRVQNFFTGIQNSNNLLGLPPIY